MVRHPLSSFDQVRIISLPSRADRRQAMTAEIMGIGGFDGERIRFFDAVRPEAAGTFPSIGARGCFLSHLEVLREARDGGARSVLILEDDLSFAPDFSDRGAAQLAVTERGAWGIFYGCYRLDRGSARPEEGVALPSDLGLGTTAFVAFAGEVLPSLIGFLEACMARPAGSPEYGPMHVDGAYSVFRRLHPEVRTFAADPQLGYQRSSRSDVTPRSRLLSALGGVRRLLRPRGRDLRRSRR